MNHIQTHFLTNTFVATHTCALKVYIECGIHHMLQPRQKWGPMFHTCTNLFLLRPVNIESML